MTEAPNYRRERIERLFNELRHEITRGMLEGEIDEEIHFNFVIPVSKHFPKGCVIFKCETRPSPDAHMLPIGVVCEPRLKVVK
ncbi:hypothetical protein LCGC14_1447510 [marine sediment metagenome]|uniref:Uncharacterized protein n=1 Tax=marine sediment metagenome TaxID=412755 RepID=A0A0F9LZ87_9ZZZZ